MSQQPTPSSKKRTRVHAEALSDVGFVRSVNEDRFWVAPDDFDAKALEKKGQLFVVADGMGGYEAGEVAAEIVATTMGESFYSKDNKAQDIAESLRLSVQKSQEGVTADQNTHAAHAQMGSTLVAAVLRGDDVVVANVGDARCYRLREGKLQLLSTDHSWVAEQVRAGVLRPEEVKGHPLRSAVTRAIGQAQASPEPTIETYDWQHNDRLLLCSDGLWDMVSDDKIAQILSLRAKSKDAADALVKAANDAGGADNITVIVVGDLPEPPLLQKLLAPEMLPKVILALGGVLGLLLISLVLSLSGAFNGAPEPTSVPPPPPPSATARKPSAPPTPQAAQQNAVAPANTAPATASIAQPQTNATPTLAQTPDSSKPKVSASPSPTVSAVVARPATVAARLEPLGQFKFCAFIRAGETACANTRSTFPISGTQRVYASWLVPEITEGIRFRVEWFRNGKPYGPPDVCVIVNGVCEPAKDARPTYSFVSLPTDPAQRSGAYSFRLYVGDAVVPAVQGSFSVR